MQIESYGLSDIGLKRPNNEDAWGAIPELGFYVLADGMGGHQAGEIASNEAVDNLLKTIRHLKNVKKALSSREIELELKEAILEANAWVYHLSEQEKSLRGMGTTLCCMLAHANFLFFAHVGDSRIYRFRNRLELLTKDHSLRKEVFTKNSLYNPEETPPSFKNVITRAIGTSPHVEPDMNRTTTQPGDIYFLCSDGLTDFVEEEVIAEILHQKKDLKTLCETLLETALKKGGGDNITLVMIRVL